MQLQGKFDIKQIYFGKKNFAKMFTIYRRVLMVGIYRCGSRYMWIRLTSFPGRRGGVGVSGGFQVVLGCHCDP